MLKDLSEAMTNFCRVNTNRKTKLPIRSSEMGVLIYIHEFTKKEGVRLVEISEYFGIRKPSVSGIIKTLEKKGYIYKTQSTEDKRNTPIFPTEKGITLVRDMIEEYHKVSQQIIKRLGKAQTEQFINTLNIVTNIIQHGGIE